MDPPLSSSHACLHMAFIANSVPFAFLSLGQFHPVLLPHLREWGKGWWLSIGFGALSPGHRTGMSQGHGVHSVFHTGVHRPMGMFASAGPFRQHTFQPSCCTACALRGHCVHLPGNSPKIACHPSASTANPQSPQDNNQHMRGHMGRRFSLLAHPSTHSSYFGGPRLGIWA